MWIAALWGAVAGSAVFLGAVMGIGINFPKKLIALIMAFGTGTLIGAATLELLRESVEKGGLVVVAVSFLTGALTYTFFDFLVARKGAHQRKRSRENPQGHSGLAIFTGTVIDAIPESVIIGVSLLEGKQVSWALVTAVFVSNFPEGLSSSVGLQKNGYSKTKILILWSAVLFLSSLSAWGGYFFMGHASEMWIGAIGAFAAGGVLAMISSTMMPEAYEEGGPIVGFIASLGVIVSLTLIHLE